MQTLSPPSLFNASGYDNSRRLIQGIQVLRETPMHEATHRHGAS